MSKNLSDIFPPTEIGGGGGGIEEAPKTGKMYARKDEAWEEFVAGDIEPGNKQGEILKWSTVDAEWMPSDEMVVYNGRVGIGIEMPVQKFEVHTSGITQARFVSGASDASILNFGTAALPADGRISYSNFTRMMQFRTASGAYSFNIDDSGRVGIGGTPSRSTKEIEDEAEATLRNWDNKDKKPTKAEIIEHLTERTIGGGTAMLQVDGGVYFSDDVVCKGIYNSENYNCGGILFTGGPDGPFLGPVDNTGTLSDGELSLGRTGAAVYRFKDAYFSGNVYATNVFRDGSVLMSAKDLIETLTTLRNATKDETTIEGLRDAIGNAVGGLIEKFEAMQAEAVTQEVAE